MKTGVDVSARTLGIDLASADAGTAAAVLVWEHGHGRLVDLRCPASDDHLERLAHGVDVVAIDAPLGWPRRFAQAVAAHSSGRPFPLPWNDRDLRMRRTDVALGLADRLWPLSVSTDRIAIVAFRAAALLPRLGRGAGPARDGSDGIIEVYPAAALRRWGLPHRAYKHLVPGHAAARARILEALVESFGVDLGGQHTRILDSGDCLDALVAALVAREYQLGRTEAIPAEAIEHAREEGWIHLPRTGGLTAEGGLGMSWTDDALWTKLGEHEQTCVAAGMRPNAVHSYWDYARRFLDWRVGAYDPRGVGKGGRKAAIGPATIGSLMADAHAYAGQVAAAGRQQPTVDTYYRHAMFFIRWLDGDFDPGARLRRR